MLILVHLWGLLSCCTLTECLPRPACGCGQPTPALQAWAAFLPVASPLGAACSVFGIVRV